MQRILIVEDDAENNQIIRDYLEGHGYSCAQAYSGSEGKLLFLMENFDLVLLDLMLPGIPGEELVSLFSKTVPVIVLSAKSGLDSKVDVLSAGAEDYICKPFDLPELLVRIQIRLRSRNRDRNGTEAGAAAAEETGGGGLLRRAGPAGPGGHGADPPADGGDEGRPPLRGDLRRVSPGPRPGSS